MLCCPKGFVNSSGSGGAMDGAILSLFFRRFFRVGRNFPFDLRKIWRGGNGVVSRSRRAERPGIGAIVATTGRDSPFPSSSSGLPFPF